MPRCFENFKKYALKGNDTKEASVQNLRELIIATPKLFSIQGKWSGVRKTWSKCSTCHDDPESMNA